MTKHVSIALLFILFLPIESCSNSENNQKSTTENETIDFSVPNNMSDASPEVNVVSEKDKIPTELIPEGYSIFEKFSGDLNKDGIKDSVFIVKKINKENIVINEYEEIVDRNRRGIMIFFNNTGKWELAVKNMNCFSSENEDGGVYFPPELYLGIEKGNLYIHYGHGRYGFWKYTFRYKNTDFELIGYDSSSNHGPITNSETSINFLTKRKLVRENINENTEESGEEIYEETWEDIDIDKRIKLSEIEDFDELYF